MKRSNWLLIAIIVLLAICVVMLGFYFYNVTSHFSTDSNDWGNFGGYLGSITGVLAFAGVLYSIQQSSKAHTEDSQRSTFFQLLELHTNKMNAVEFEGKKGAEAFKEYTNIANKNTEALFARKYFQEKCLDINENELLDIYNNKNGIFNFLDFTFSIDHNDSLYVPHYMFAVNDCLKKINSARVAINRNDFIKDLSRINTDLPRIKKILENYIIECEVKTISEFMESIGNSIYKEYGHITGHYFRNMFYVMKTIKGFSDNEKYIELFRAQLSRYELALGLFNAVSSNSSEEMISLLKEFKVFKDIYPEDVTIIKALFESYGQQGGTDQEKISRIVNNVLDVWKSA